MKKMIHILHAEDDTKQFEDCEKAIRKYFKHKEYEFTIKRAINGTQVYKFASDPNQKIDVLLLDIQMIYDDGIQTAEGIAERYPNIPIIIISAYAEVPEYTRKLEDMQSKGIIKGYFNVLPENNWCMLIEEIIGNKKVSVLQLSDIHFGESFAFKDNTYAFDTVFSQLCSQLGKIDIVLVSGDISSKGTKKEFKEAIDTFKRISELIKVPKDKFVFIPGNHDVDFTVVEKNDRFEGFLMFLNHFQDSGQSRIFKHFSGKQTILDYLYDEINPSKCIEDAIFVISVFEDLKTIVIGLNSVNNSSINKELNVGLISEQQLINIQNVLNDHKLIERNYFVIATFHHNIFELPRLFGDGGYSRSLVNQGLVFKTLFRNNTRIIFHGHSHYASAFKFCPYYFDDEKRVSNSSGYIVSSGTFSGKNKNPLQNYFSVNHLTYQIDIKNQVSNGVLKNYNLKLDDNLWKESNLVQLEI